LWPGDGDGRVVAGNRDEGKARGKDQRHNVRSQYDVDTCLFFLFAFERSIYFAL
jgi:hypothetical protein